MDNLATVEVSAERIASIRLVTRRVLTSLAILLVALAGHLIWAGAQPAKLSVPLILFVCGAIGGFVSIQRRLKQLDDEDLQLMRASWVYTALSPMVGGVLALVLYMLFLSGLLSGDLFPKFDEDKTVLSNGFATIFAQHGANFRVYAKLLFWSFVAGYSEKFVTDIIGSFQKQP